MSHGLAVCCGIKNVRRYYDGPLGKLSSTVPYFHRKKLRPTEITLLVPGHTHSIMAELELEPYPLGFSQLKLKLS